MEKENENEIWKEVNIDGYRTYEVSNLGNVRNSDTDELLALSTKNGYKYITLRRKNNKDKSFRVHRLVAITFIPNDNPKRKRYVNHKDGNKTNNKVSNLEWITPSNNSKHAIENGLIKRLVRKVHQYDQEGNLIKTFNSIKEASKEIGINSTTISAVCRGRMKLAGGFIWQYENDEAFQKGEAPIDSIPIKNYPAYSITKDGKVYSHTKKIYRKFNEVDGYNRVQLHNKGKVQSFLVQRLVAEAFIPNPDNKPQVNHKNKKIKDNRVENLEWATGPENILHAINFDKNNQQASDSTK